jgi:hypothetical protein
VKKTALAIAAVLAIAASVAASAAASSGPVLLAEGFVCLIRDVDGTNGVTFNSQAIYYPSGDKVVVSCEAYVAEPPAAPLSFSYENTGEPCVVPGSNLTTVDWVNRIGRNGKTRITCTFYGPFFPN